MLPHPKRDRPPLARRPSWKHSACRCHERQVPGTRQDDSILDKCAGTSPSAPPAKGATSVPSARRPTH